MRLIERKTNGFTRTVFLVGRYAVKVPCCRYGWRIFLNGLLANIQERAFGRVGWPEVLPVLWADSLGIVVVMPRVQVLKRELSDPEYEALCHGKEYWIPAEHKRDSFGVYEGRIVAIDYGS